MRAFPLLFLCLSSPFCLVTEAQTTPTPSKAAETINLSSEKNGLKISISPTFKIEDDGKGPWSKGVYSLKYAIALQPIAPHINVVLQNTTSKPLRIFTEGNSWGYLNMTLQITKIDGKDLDKPLMVARAPRGWFGNVPSTFVIEPGESIVREVGLRVSPLIFDPKTPIDDFDRSASNPLYDNFPFPDKPSSRQVTMSAIFSNDEAVSNNGVEKKSVWVGQIASPSVEYEVAWEYDYRNPDD